MREKCKAHSFLALAKKLPAVAFFVSSWIIRFSPSLIKSFSDHPIPLGSPAKWVWVADLLLHIHRTMIYTYSILLYLRTVKISLGSKAVFQIRDILVRIRISGSVPLTNGSGYGAYQRIRLRILLFSSVTFKTPRKNNFFSFFCLFLWRYIYIILQRKNVTKKSQNSRNIGFSYYFWFMMEGSGSVPPTNGSSSGSGRRKNLQIPEHCLFLCSQS